ncbi:toll-like receptor 2 [Mytilus galloprovincialis]|uniref:toll-like receptor 2 n=1 Tax=Mytilus galloprovincialis TaxID=29158 RepID=UPI003F7BDD2D
MRLFIVFLQHIVQIVTTPCPNAPRCVCNEERHYANCINTNLPQIPVIPSYVTSLDFSGNQLHQLKRSTFISLETLKLENLSLAKNFIAAAEADALNNLSHLRLLDLSRNVFMPSSVAATVIRSLRSSFFSTLILNMMPWRFSRNDTIEDLLCDAHTSNLTSLSLKHSFLRNLSLNEIGKCVPHLQLLDGSHGRIQSVSSSFLHEMKELNLQYNYLSIRRGFFGNKPNCYFPEIEVLRLDNNNIDDFDDRFSCLDSLKILTLHNNAVRRISNGTFKYLPSLSMLSLSSLYSKLRVIAGSAFQSKTLYFLNLSGNGFEFIDQSSKYRFDKDCVFKYSPNLTQLDLSGNIINPYEDVLTTMLLPLKSLQKLWLKNCNMFTLPSGFFYKMPHLQEFIASYNNISAWDGNIVFGDNFTLKTLKLNSNSISIVEQSFFPLTSLNQFTKLYLRLNQFSCTCENLWFRNLIRKRPSLFADVFPGYRCLSPPYKVGTYLTDYNPTNDECDKRDKVFLVVVASISVIGIVLVIVSSILYRCRWHIRYWIYLSTTKRRGLVYHSLVEESSQFVYDAFVIYCDSDRNWVRTQLIDKVEKESGLNLCIHHRDFKAGQLIIDNIAENIAASRKILLLMSRDMLRSNWCLFEMRIAQERFLNKETDTMIVVMLETVSKDLMSPSLRFLINSTTYIEWPRKQYEEERFWNEVLRALQ